MTSASSPYVGPRPFERTDGDRFFGRDREPRDLFSLVVAHPMVLLYARSGAGKTSLLNARLIPMLEHEGFEVLPARVGRQAPVDAGEQEGENVFVHNVLSGWQSQGEPTNLSLVSFLRIPSPSQKEGFPVPRVLVFDQFEELFTSCPERWRERQGFFEQVAEALEEIRTLRVLIAVRDDFLAQIEPYAELLPEELGTRFHLERLREEAALEAVNAPLRGTGRSFAKGVAEDLVADLLRTPVLMPDGSTRTIDGEFVEPVQLQVVCQSLWENLRDTDTVITKEHLNAFGDVDQALSLFYENAVRKAAQEGGIREGLLRRWLGETLITPIGTRGSVFQDQHRTDGIPDRCMVVLENLHVIRGEWRGGARWYELNHDRLIEPIQESNRKYFMGISGAEHLRESLERRAQEWDAGGRGVKGLLEEVNLLAAESWLEGPEAEEIGFSDLLQSFVDSSRAAFEAAKNERDAAQRQELEQAQALAEARRKRLRELRVGLLLLTALLAGMAVLVAYLTLQQAALREAREQNLAQKEETEQQRQEKEGQRRETEQQRQVARSRELIADAMLSLQVNPERSLMLAKAALDTAEPNPQTEALLRVALSMLSPVEMVLREPEHGTVWSVAVGPDGKRLASGYEDGTLIVWSMPGGSKLLEQRIHGGAIRGIAFSPEPELIATASADGTARLWDVGTGRPRHTPLVHGGKVNSAAFGPGGMTLITSSDDGHAYLWNLAQGTRPRKLPAAGRVYDAVFSPDGSRVATVGSDRATRLWSVSSAAEESKWTDHEGAVYGVAFSTDGRLLATGSFDRTALIRDVKTGRVLQKLRGHEGPIHAVSFSSDGRLVATASGDRTVRLWNVDSGRETRVFRGHSGEVKALALSSSGSSPITAGSDASVRVWADSENKVLLIPREPRHRHRGWLTDATFSGDGQWIVSSSQDETARIWDARSSELLHTLSGAHRSPVWGVAVQPKQKIVATAGAGGVALWDPQQKKKEYLDGPSAGVARSVAFSADGNLLVSAGSFGAQVWDIARKPRIKVCSIPGRESQVRNAALSPKRPFRIATAHQSGVVELWDVQKCRKIRELVGHSGPVRDVTFHPREDLLATAGEDGTVRLWKGSSDESVAELRGHSLPVNSVAFSPDGKLLVSGGDDWVARVWEPVTGHVLAELREQTEPVSRAEFSPDGAAVLTASTDRYLRIYSCVVCGSIQDLLKLSRARRTPLLEPPQRRRMP